MSLNVYITGSGHSGSTLLDRLLGSHPDIAALGEVHRFSLGLHRSEMPFRCDCGDTVADCAFWRAVTDRLSETTGLGRDKLVETFQTTDHSVLSRASGERYFGTGRRYQFLPRHVDKYLLSVVPRALAGGVERTGALGLHLVRARNSGLLFDAVREVSGRGVVVDSTKNPGRMRALYLATRSPLKVIYLKRDGRAVAESRMRREGVSMGYAARVWVAENRKVRFTLGRMKGVPVLDVRYEDLCRDAAGEFERICNFLGIPACEPHLQAERHAIGGNPSRFGRNEIVIDETWRSRLNEDDLRRFEKVAGSQASR